MAIFGFLETDDRPRSVVFYCAFSGVFAIRFPITLTPRLIAGLFLVWCHMQKNIFSIYLIESDGIITAQADYDGAGGAVLEIGLELMTRLSCLDAAGESVRLRPILRGSWVH